MAETLPDYSKLKKSGISSDHSWLDTRFKDAALLLASESTSAIISGIYALHQVAIEASKGGNSQKGYVKIVNDILCAYLREGTVEVDGERQCKFQQVVVQTIVDVLFKNEGDIYHQYLSDLSGVDFDGIDFTKATISYTDFRWATINHTDFIRATISHTYFVEATINDTDFSGATISNTDFIQATISKTKFKSAIISNTYFSGATISYTNFREANLTSVNFWFDECHKKTKLETVDFSGTKLTNYIDQEIIERAHEITTP